MKHKPMPDLNFLRSILDYNPDTGVFRWKVNRGENKVIGQIAGCLWYNPKNPEFKYHRIIINRNQYKAHRLAYYYFTSIDPNNLQIDHINGNGLDNRFNNLRLSTQIDNTKNLKKPIHNTSGIKGVSYDKQNKKWKAQIQINKKNINLGRFDSKLYAAVVYARAEKHYFGEWRRDRKHING